MVKIEINFEQLKKVIQQLPAEDRERLLRSFKGTSANKSLESLFKRIDSQLRKNPISQEEIARSIENTRRKLYGPRRR